MIGFAILSFEGEGLSKGAAFENGGDYEKLWIHILYKGLD